MVRYLIGQRMRKPLSSILILLALTIPLSGASGTPSTLVVRVDANGYLVVTAATQTNPITSGVFSSRVLKTDASGNLQVILAGTVTPTYPQSIPASTCAAPSLGESGAATTGIAFTATPSILNCIAGTAVTTLTSTLFTSTATFIGPVGSASAPTYSFTGDTGVGVYRNASGFLGLVGSTGLRFIANSTTVAQFDTTDGYIIRDTLPLQFGSSGTASPDVSISRLSADNLRLGNNDKFNLFATSLGITSTDGQINQNSTAATSGVTVQISPRTRLSGTAWDTDDAVSRTVSVFTEVLPSSGTTVSGMWKLGVIDPVSSAITYPLTVSLGGTLSMLNSSAFAFGTRGWFQKNADGLAEILANNGTVGIQFNTGTAAPTCSANCAVTSGSRNTTGEMTLSGGATSGTVTFGSPNWTNTPFCVLTEEQGTNTAIISSVSVSTFVFSGVTANGKFMYHCIGRI